MRYRRTGVGAASHDHDGVDATTEERRDVVPLSQRIATGVAKEDRHLSSSERILGTHEDRQAEAALQI